jgi:hypothetical protein
MSACALLKPVTLPPGRAKLFTSPPTNGSAPPAITIGMSVVTARAERARGSTRTNTANFSRKNSLA